MQNIIRAIDTGYGNIKYTISDSSTGNIKYGIFPARAPVESSRFLSTRIGSARDTVSVKVNGAMYEVGPDVHYASTNFSSRPTHSNYMSTDHYMACTLGALAYMKEKVIDVLVVGLPITMLESRGKELSLMLQGVHHINDDTHVTVQKVITVAQPIGGYLDHLYSNPSSKGQRSKTSLIIDPGYYTVDFLIANGLHPTEERSGIHEGGMSRIISLMMRALNNDMVNNTITSPYTDSDGIDRGLVTGEFRIYGKPVNLNQYLKYAEPYINDVINVIHTRVGETYDVDQILLLGGAAHYFSDALHKKYSDLPIIRPDNSIFSNVRGFQLIGENYMRHIRESKSA